MESMEIGWQVVSLCGISFWIVTSSKFEVTKKLRSLTQPWVSHHVKFGTPIIINIQKYQHRQLDAFFSGLSFLVSVPFFTAFLPLLFWTGHSKLARQMTLLIAFCDYIGNCIKDVVSAPRPSSPPVRRVVATMDEEVNAMEYGLPSTHTLITVCLSGYLLHYILDYTESNDLPTRLAGFILACLVVGLTAFGRMYLGMHSFIDIIGGLALGLGILVIWLSVSQYIDDFIVSGQNVGSFLTALCVLLIFAYPTPELPTPSFEYHTAFNGVILGIVIGVNQTFHQFHHENVARVFSLQLTFPAFVGRVLIGIPTILAAKLCSKALAKWILPIFANALGIPVRSTSYIPSLNKQVWFDVDVGIRFVQYAALAWSVVHLVPSIFSHLGF